MRPRLQGHCSSAASAPPRLQGCCATAAAAADTGRWSCPLRCHAAPPLPARPRLLSYCCCHTSAAIPLLPYLCCHTSAAILTPTCTAGGHVRGRQRRRARIAVHAARQRLACPSRPAAAAPEAHRQRARSARFLRRRALHVKTREVQRTHHLGERRGVVTAAGTSASAAASSAEAR
eukprot:357691-Chlamydomonas_euryale.AAC.1